MAILMETQRKLFPQIVTSVDTGSGNVLAKSKEYEKCFAVKAGRENFSQNNITVITADGRLYCFLAD